MLFAQHDGTLFRASLLRLPGGTRQWGLSATPMAGRISRSIINWNGTTRAPKTAILPSRAKLISLPATGNSSWRSVSEVIGGKPDSRRDLLSSKITTEIRHHYVSSMAKLAQHPAARSTIRSVKATCIASAWPCFVLMNRRISRRHHCQPLDTLGIQQGRRRSRRLPSGLAARSGRNRWRACGRGAVEMRFAYCATSKHAGSRRPLGAKSLARRTSLLGRHPDG